MPIYDTECRECGFEQEVISGVDEYPPCSKCGGPTNRLISARGPNCANEDAAWIRDVLEVVDKEGGPHCQRFLHNPTRRNYLRWKAEEGVRHFEPGEKPVTKLPDPARIKHYLMTKLQKRRRIEVHGQAF